VVDRTGLINRDIGTGAPEGAPARPPFGARQYAQKKSPTWKSGDRAPMQTGWSNPTAEFCSGICYLSTPSRGVKCYNFAAI